jgi:flagellar motility protein MotE (MotC chaperone)
VSDTPRTDAAYAASTGVGIYELFKESQDIERELNAANERIKELEAKVDELHDLEKWLEGR